MYSIHYIYLIWSVLDDDANNAGDYQQYYWKKIPIQYMVHL